MHKRNTIFVFAITIFLSLGIYSCKRVPPTPPSDSPSASPTPDPADAQPKTADDFFKKMADAGYTKKKEEIAADIKKLSALKISAWDTNVKISAMFDANKANFTTAPKDANDFKAKGLDFAKKPNDFYVDFSKGSASNTYPLLKIDPKTFELVLISAKGTILSYDQGKAVPTAKQLLFVPPDVYK